MARKNKTAEPEGTPVVTANSPDYDKVDEIAKIIASLDSQANRRADVAKGARAESAEAKLKAYSNVIWVILTQGLRQGDNRNNPGDGPLFREKLKEHKVSEAQAVRYWTNSFKLINSKAYGVDVKKVAGSGATAVLAFLNTKKLKTEAAIRDCDAAKLTMLARIVAMVEKNLTTEAELKSLATKVQTLAMVAHSKAETAKAKAHELGNGTTEHSELVKSLSKTLPNGAAEASASK